ncbi:beta-lactamase family protein [Streptomyces sp. 15-116A]|uniref:serine hydrolase domain-containing protein n=1 Tax=Streptomyces sp. 15-116A TaxID=2259035 RepID=UPI0021B33071|nr:serine hydrolase domain-containing protein [Streptomyces sp. 15-116A]MCT7351885.1 beta-lactamase family protein [Streptomyces sp. 15-116A]
MTQEIHGTVAGGFEGVREEFAAVVAAERPDYEGQLCAYLHGRRVVDLWSAGSGPDTLYGVHGSTKGAAFLVVAVLVQDGTLELDRKVTYYWPEFAAEGKGMLTLRDLLTHRAGVVGTDTGFTLAELADDRALAERLADQRPFWRPGTAFGYHALVIGALAGEVVRRATGHTLQQVYEDRIRTPYALDLHLGLPAAHEPRFRPTRPLDPTPTQQIELDASPRGPHTLNSIAYNRNAPLPTDLATLPNDPLIRTRGPASVGGVASARGLAGLYAAAISASEEREPLLKPDTIAELGQLHATGHDLVAGTHRTYALGFQATAETWHPFLGAGSFGHSGTAGSQAFADPRSGLAYGYTRRRCAYPAGAAPENDRLAQAIHRAAVAHT